MQSDQPDAPSEQDSAADVAQRASAVSWRHSWAARVTAVGFIAFILFGNLWLAQALTGGKGSTWVMSGFTLGLSVAAVGGVGLGALALLRLLRGLGAGDATGGEPSSSDNPKNNQ